MLLHLTSSNRFERLLDALLSGMASAGHSPLEPDRIIVPSMGVRRRIELATADRFGICANVQFRFLAQWLWEQIAKVVPGVDETSPFAPARLSWRVFRLLGDAGFTTRHAVLRRYLADADDLMRYELAQRIAMLFDQYITYRPDWLDAWSANRTIAQRDANGAFEHEPWQAALWRLLVEELGAARQHPSVAFFNAIRSGRVDAQHADLPRVAHVFCLPAIPPLYVDTLRELARWTDLHVYMLNPCEEYWAEIVAPRRVAQLRASRKADYHEVGNRLLAQWGQQTRAHLHLTLEKWQGAMDEASEYVATTSDTLLATVQQSMLDLVELEPTSLYPLRDDDRSIEVHVCHSLTRELEVLQDQLLAMFADDPSLQASDVLVVTPQLEEAAPLIEAVFGNAPEHRRIPFDITGRARSTQNTAAHALLDLLTLATSRFHASAVFELLQQPIVARRFELDASSLESIRGWIRAAGIRWGLDADHRASFELPALERHSFADGLGRLFLGYALPRSSVDPIADLLPAGNPEGTDALALGSFAHAMREFEALRREVARTRSAADWLTTLQHIVASFLEPADAELEDMRELEAALRILHDEMSTGAQSTPITLNVVRTALEQALDDPARGGVPGGAVTFASMTSLRNLPYRIVCAIGLADGVFPALERPLEFDLIAALPRAGDRQRRAEDRNVFLDLVLAARERLYLSYVGRNIRDNTELPPSVVISDLLDAIVPAIVEDPRSAAATTTARARLVIEHPLQAFSIRYFERDATERIRSFNDEYCHALQKRARAPVTVNVPAVVDDFEDADEVVRDPQRPFFTAPLAVAGEEWRTITLARLHRFFWNPCRFLLKERLGITLPEAEDELPDDEPFTAEWKARCALADRLLPPLLAGRSIDDVRLFARAGIEYPTGRHGERLIDAELVYLETFAAAIRRDSMGIPLDTLTHEITFDIDGAPWRLQGSFSDLRSSGRVRYRYDETRATERLAGWIDHLFLNAIDAPVTKSTVWHSRDGSFAFPPIDDACEHLRNLVALYVEGLCKPLHFFPRTSWTFVEEGERLSAAEGKWLTTPSYRFGEDRDAAYQLCLRGVEPLDDDFIRCARVVFGPAFAAIQDGRIGKP